MLVLLHSVFTYFHYVHLFACVSPCGESGLEDAEMPQTTQTQMSFKTSLLASQGSSACTGSR